MLNVPESFWRDLLAGTSRPVVVYELARVLLMGEFLQAKNALLPGPGGAPS